MLIDDFFLLKCATTLAGSRTARNYAKEVGTMFRNAAGQTHGAQVIAGANAAQDPSMSGQADAAASKAQADSQKMQLQNFQKQQQESSKHQAELQKQQLAMQHQQFEFKQQAALEKHKMDIQRMIDKQLAAATAAQPVAAPAPGPDLTLKALGNHMSTVAKDLHRLASGHS